jgi:hypothetical protein
VRILSGLNWIMRDKDQCVDFANMVIGENLEQLSYFRILKNVSAPWRKLG